MQIDINAIIHGVRQHIDADMVEVEFLSEKIDRGLGGREVALARTKLKEAKMWLGAALEQRGSELPAKYRDSSEEGSAENTEEESK